MNVMILCWSRCYSLSSDPRSGSGIQEPLKRRSEVDGDLLLSSGSEPQSTTRGQQRAAITAELPSTLVQLCICPNVISFKHIDARQISYKYDVIVYSSVCPSSLDTPLLPSYLGPKHKNHTRLLQ